MTLSWSFSSRLRCWEGESSSSKMTVLARFSMQASATSWSLPLPM